VVKQIQTGIKASEPFDFNLEKAMDLIASIGYDRAWEKLESMKVYRWVGHSMSFESCDCLICEIMRQVEYDQVMARCEATAGERIEELQAKYNDDPDIRPYSGIVNLNRRPYRR